MITNQYRPHPSYNNDKIQLYKLRLADLESTRTSDTYLLAKNTLTDWQKSPSQSLS